MIKVSKKIVSLFLIMMLFFNFSTITNATDQKLYDYSKLLTEEEAQEIETLSRETADRIQMDIVIVTTDDDEGKSPMDYADDFYDYNGFGYGEYKYGILLYINMTTRDIWISTTGNLRKYVDDVNQVKLRDDVTSYLSAGAYYDAFIEFITETENYINAGIPNYEYVYDPATDSNIQNDGYVNYKVFLVAGVAGLIVALITVIVVIRRYKFHSVPTAANYIDRKDTFFREKNDTFLREHTTRIKIETDSGSGGGFSGGSSSHHSSSGSSHGGCGGKF